MGDSLLTSSQCKLIAFTSMGGALEFFDFTIYALFAPYISHAFFPHAVYLVSLLNTFAVFALGYLARPLGGIIFGHIGDKYGRKRAFITATFLMALSTLLIAFLPTYAMVGSIAPLLLILLRLLQGFSVGGEIPGATVFVAEHLDSHRRGFGVAVVFTFITLGNVLAGLLGFVLTTLLSQHAMQLWGWRIPFILGFALGIVSYIVRKRAVESPIFKAMEQAKKTQRVPFFSVLQKSPGRLIQAFALTGLSASVVVLSLFLPTYLSVILHYHVANAYFTTTMSFLVLSVSTLCFGALSDYVGRRFLMILSGVLIIVVGYFIFQMLVSHDAYAVWVFSLVLSGVAGMANGCYATAIAELFPTNLRYTGMGTSYNLGYALIGGFGPLVITYLIKITGHLTAPYYYLIFGAGMTIVAALFFTKGAKALDLLD